MAYHFTVVLKFSEIEKLDAKTNDNYLVARNLNVTYIYIYIYSQSQLRNTNQKIYIEKNGYIILLCNRIIIDKMNYEATFDWFFTQEKNCW